MRAYFRVADSAGYQRPFDFTKRMFHAWAKQGFYSTDIADWPKEWRGKRYTSFGALLTARMIAMLRSRGISSQRISAAHTYLQQVTRYEYPFIAKPIWTDAARFPNSVYASIDRDQYAADLFGQFIFPELIKIERVHQANLEFTGRPTQAAKWEVAPGVMIDPLMHGGEPCVKGRRLPTATLRVENDLGVPTRDIGGLYNVDESQVEAALDWERRLAEFKVGVHA